MGKDTSSDNKATQDRCVDHNQTTMVSVKVISNPSKTKYSLWGSQIVKGFTTDKKTKLQGAIPSKKQPAANCTEISSQKNQYVSCHSRVKRSLVGDFPCSANVAQVHPHVLERKQIASPASHDLFLELDQLRELLRESKEREIRLRAELLQFKENPRVAELERAFELKKADLEKLVLRVSSLEAENSSLSEELVSLSSALQCHERKISSEDHASDKSAGAQKPSYRDLELEIFELRRLTKELQFQKRNIAFRLSSAESELAAVAKITENDVVAKAQAEASVLRHTNENLSKQVEGLQMNRLNEVEELAYLRWMNSCLRHELSNSDKNSNETIGSDDGCNCNSSDTIMRSSIDTLPSPFFSSKSVDGDACTPRRMSLVKRLTTWSRINEDHQNSDCKTARAKYWIKGHTDMTPSRRHSVGGTEGYLDGQAIKSRRQSDSFVCSKEIHNKALAPDDIDNNNQQVLTNKHSSVGSPNARFSERKLEPCKFTTVDIGKRALRIPNPPPRPSTSLCSEAKEAKSLSVPPPPPPPPPPPKFSAKSTGVMQRAPQVAELYHSLMKRDSRKDCSGGGTSEVPDVAHARSSMIGEIENRSSHLMAIKADVETQGDFVKYLMKEVNDATYNDIEDVVAFVKWLDDELCFLVDERAVLKHFDWPEKKADTLREAAFGYLDLKKLDSEVAKFQDDPRLPCDIALKKIVALSEKVEQSIYNLVRTRDPIVRRCKEFQIPTDWMLDNGLISKIKFGSVKLAKKYMKRVSTELKAMEASNKDPALEYMLLQGVRFAFRIHQFAGGFDAETMRVFEELRNVAYVRNET